MTAEVPRPKALAVQLASNSFSLRSIFKWLLSNFSRHVAEKVLIATFEQLIARDSESEQKYIYVMEGYSNDSSFAVMHVQVSCRSCFDRNEENENPAGISKGLESVGSKPWFTCSCCVYLCDLN